ncbi:MAG TPA: ester cyclase [Polyangiaceae bacterium]|nr:ester cyclase [Polyangiaceae bacterium]
MRKLGTFAALSVLGLIACGQQEPAATPLAAPPPATVAATPPAPPAEAKPEEPKPVPLTPEQKVKAYQDGWAAFNAKDFAKFQSIWADNATSEALDMGPPKVGPQAIADDAKAFASAFPDATGELELTLVNGNNIVGIVLQRGTQKGTYETPMGPVPATNKKVGFLLAHGIELNDAGKAQKQWLAYDGGTVAGQLGLMQMPHRKVMETGWTDKPTVIATGSDGEKANLAAFNKEVEGFNKHDAAAALANAADDLVFSELSAPADRTGKKESLKGMEEMFKAFPDVKLDVKNAWPAGDYVVALGSWSGTNTGDMPSAHLKKTGKPVTVQFVEIDKFAGGKTKNIWIFSNGAAVAAQLGLMAPKGEAKAGAAKGGKEAKPGAEKPAAKPAATPAAAKAAK